MRSTVLAERIEKELRDKNLTHRKLAQSIGVSTQVIDNIINGKTNNPTKPVAEKIARYFGCNPEELASGTILKGPTQDVSFKVIKDDAIRAAIELCYGDDVERELKAAKTVGEINRIMKSARDRM